MIHPTIGPALGDMQAQGRDIFNLTDGEQYWSIYVCRETPGMTDDMHCGGPDCPCGPLFLSEKDHWLELSVKHLVAMHERHSLGVLQ